MSPQPDEHVLYDSHPSAWFVILRPLSILFILLLLLIVGPFLVPLFISGPFDLFVWFIALATLALIVMAANAIIRSCRRYIITERRVLLSAGVFSRVSIEAPLTRIQTLAVMRSFSQRLLGVGNITFTTAGEDLGEIGFWMIPDPDRLLVLARCAVDQAQRSQATAPRDGAGA